MNEKSILRAIGNVENQYIQEAEPQKQTRTKFAWKKWTAMAACLAVVIVFGIAVFNNRSVDFNSMMAEYSLDTMENITNISIENKNACYHEMPIDSSKLEKYIGERYQDADDGTWYIPSGINNFKYLIKQDSSGICSLWVFSNFVTDEGTSYTYGDVLKIIYGVNSADEFERIVTTPSNSDNTDLGKEIQSKIGTKEYTDRKSIDEFYNIVVNVICYGADSVSKGDDNRFKYSFSTNGEDKLTSGESTYGTRVIQVVLKNGTTIDSWIYDALSGCFFEYGGIFTEPLDEESVDKLNAIFKIE